MAREKEFVTEFVDLLGREMLLPATLKVVFCAHCLQMVFRDLGALPSRHQQTVVRLIRHGFAAWRSHKTLGKTKRPLCVHCEKIYFKRSI